MHHIGGYRQPNAWPVCGSPGLCRGLNLYDQPATRFVAGFIGNSNFVDGCLESNASGGTVVLPDGGRFAGAPLDRLALGQSAVSIMIRPDHLRLHTGRERDGAPRLAGTVAGATFLGDHTRLAIVTS